MSKQSRRDFLKTGVLSTLALGGGILGQSTKNKTFKNYRGEARNVIFMVADGMSSGTLALADLMKKRQYGESTHWLSLYNSDRTFHRGLMDMASLNSPVTDSAAASSSWGSGQRVNNGALNIGPDGEKHRPILQIFKDAGKRTGLVTTTRITHATPSGFAVNMPDRNSEDAIALQYLEREYDLLMGGGARHFDKKLRGDGKDLSSGFVAKKYEIVRTKQQMNAASKNGRLLGIFADSHLPYTTDQKTVSEYRESIPALAQMTAKALGNLDNENGFILQVEGGRVDHAAHENDAAGLIYDQIAFDDAIKIVLDFVDNRNDTLLIITTDHGNANPGLNGAGQSYTGAGPMLDRLQKFRHTNEWILAKLNHRSALRQIRERIEYATGISITEQESQLLKRSLSKELSTPYRVRRYPYAVLASVMANYTSINFLGGVHTSDYVELAALGPGSGDLDYFTRNTELFELMVEAAGVKEYTGR